MSKKFEISDISTYRSEIYGMSILWIMLFHAIVIYRLDYSTLLGGVELVQNIIKYGNAGCEIFLLCSGICLYYSYHNNQNILNFISKRIKRLILPVVIIDGLYWLYLLIFVEHNIWHAILRFSLSRFWITGDQQIWFVSFIAACYLLYPYLHAFIFASEQGTKKALLRSIILIAFFMLITYAIYKVNPAYYQKIEIGITRFPVFILGCFLGKLSYEKKSYSYSLYYVCLVLTVCTWYLLEHIVLTGPFKRWSLTILAIGVTYSFVFILKLLHWKVLNRFFAFFGGMSLNLYLSHIMVGQVYRRIIVHKTYSFKQYGMILIISVLIAWGSKKIMAAFSRK